MRKLGAFGSDLGAVACFFETPWSRVSPALTEADQGLAAERSRLPPARLGPADRGPRTDAGWAENARQAEGLETSRSSASNLSELELTLGEVAGAVEDAEQSVTYADRSGDAFQRMAIARPTPTPCTRRAAGPRRRRASARPRQMQAERQPDYPLLYSLQASGIATCSWLRPSVPRGK